MRKITFHFLNEYLKYVVKLQMIFKYMGIPVMSKKFGPRKVGICRRSQGEKNTIMCVCVCMCVVCVMVLK